MVSQARRQRSVSELVFVLLKTLSVGYQIWGIESGLQLAGLADLLRVSDARLIGVVAYLTEEGLVALDEGSSTVRLTPRGAGTLHAAPCGSATDTRW